MSTLSRLLCLTLLSTWLASTVFAAEPPSPPQGNQLNPFQAVETFSESVSGDGDGESNTLMFATPESMQQMRERLGDPAQRQAYREQQRQSMRQLYTDLEQALGIDAATQEKLLDLLVDRQLSTLEEFHGERRSTLEDHTKLIQARVDTQTRHLEDLRALLGEEAFERWPDYEASLGERMIAGKLDARLEAGSKLQPEQKERLIALLKEHSEQELEQQRLARTPMMPMTSVRLGEDIGRAMHLHAIAENEAQLRHKPESDRVLAERAAKFLTPAQLAALSAMHAEETAQLRRSIERMRAQVGQSAEPADSDETAPVVPQRSPIAGDVKVDLRLTVNRDEPLTLTHTVPNGGTFEFRAGDDLWVQAKATLFDDDWLDVQLSYYENGEDGKKRRLAGKSGHGMMVRQPDGSSYDLSRNGSSSTMASGRKAYYVSVSANAAAL